MLEAGSPFSCTQLLHKQWHIPHHLRIPTTAGISLAGTRQPFTAIIGKPTQNTCTDSIIVLSGYKGLSHQKTLRVHSCCSSLLNMSRDLLMHTQWGNIWLTTTHMLKITHSLNMCTLSALAHAPCTCQPHWCKPHHCHKTMEGENFLNFHLFT